MASREALPFQLNTLSIPRERIRRIIRALLYPLATDPLSHQVTRRLLLSCRFAEAVPLSAGFDQ